MSKPTVITIASLAKVAATKLVADAKADFETGRVAYLNGAKRLIALTKSVGPEKAAKMLKAAGVAEHTVKNARQLVRVYEALVVTRTVKEEWFDEINYLQAVAINAALAKRSVTDLAYCWRKSPPGAGVECELVAETGLTISERAARATRDAETARASAAAAAAGAASGPVVPARDDADGGEGEGAEAPAAAGAPGAPVIPMSAAATPSVAGKPEVPPIVEFNNTADNLELVTLSIIGKADKPTLDEIQARLVKLTRAVSEAVEAKTKVLAKKSKKAAPETEKKAA